MDALNLKFPKDFFKNYARGKPCMIRAASSCGFACDGEETTVLCHIDMAGVKAMGSRKAGAPDICAAWGCATCHGLVGGHIKPVIPIQKETMQLWHHEGITRTQIQLVKDGVLPNPV